MPSRVVEFRRRLADLGRRCPSYHARIVHPPVEETPGHSLRPAVATLGFLKLVVNSAVRFVYPLLPAIARGLGIDLAQAGALVSVRWAVGLTTPAVLGARPQTRRSRRLVIVGLAVFSAGALVTAWTGVFVGAVVGFALLGLAKPLVDIGSQIYMSERVVYEDRARYLGILELAWAGGLLFGAPAAAWLIQNWSWEAPFWAVGTLGLVSIGLATLFLDHHDDIEHAAARADDSHGRQVFLIMAMATLFGFAHESILVTMGGWLEGSFGMTLLALGGVGTLLGLSEMAGEGAMAAFTDRLGKRNSIALGFAVGAVSLFLLSMVTTELVAALSALAVTTFALEFGFISSIPIMTELRPRSRTRVLALSVVSGGSGRIAGDLISPRVFTAGGMRMVTLMASAVILCALVLVVFGVRELSPGERLPA